MSRILNIIFIGSSMFFAYNNFSDLTDTQRGLITLTFMSIQVIHWGLADLRKAVDDKYDSSR